MSTDSANPGQYLGFFVGDAEYAIDILRVREIIPYGQITRLPRVPDFVRGVTNVRGGVVPVVDLAVRLGFEANEPTQRTCIVVCELEIDGECAQIGLTADDVDQVLDLEASQLERPPSLGLSVPETFLAGVAKLEDHFVLILDVPALLAERSPGDWAALTSAAPRSDAAAGET